MGLDTVELIMNVEDRFRIQISDADAQDIQTVGQLADYVADRVGRAAPARCVSQRTFHRVRSGLIAALGARRCDVRTHSRVEEFLPAQQRVIGWAQLAAATGFRLPDLERPQWMINALLLLPLLVMTATAIWNWRALIVAVWVGFLLMFMGFALTRPLAVAVPRSAGTVADLVRRIVAMNFIDGEELRDAEVFSVVADIVSYQAGVAREHIERDTHFMNDLHFN